MLPTLRKQLHGQLLLKIVNPWTKFTEATTGHTYPGFTHFCCYLSPLWLRWTVTWKRDYDDISDPTARSRICGRAAEHPCIMDQSSTMMGSSPEPRQPAVDLLLLVIVLTLGHHGIS